MNEKYKNLLIKKMDKLNLFIRTDNNSNLPIRAKLTPKIPNLKAKSGKKNKSSNSTKLKFSKNVLIDLLKKSNLKKRKSKNFSHTQLKSNNNNFQGNNHLYTNYQVSNNLENNFYKFPNLSNYHNLTDDKLSNLLSTSNKRDINSINPYTNTNMKPNSNVYSFHPILTGKENNLLLLNKVNKRNKVKIENQSDHNIKNNSINNKSNGIRRSFDSKIYKLKSKKIEKNNTENINYLDKNQNPKNDHNSNNKDNKDNKDKNNHNNESVISRKNKIREDTISWNLKKIKLVKMNNKAEIQKWLKSIKESINQYDVLNRGSKVDRLIFLLERPGECFEENLGDKKAGDKYQLLKNQISKQKYRLEAILNEMRLNQIKSEYLMKKYIFGLLSRKKKIY